MRRLLLTCLLLLGACAGDDPPQALHPNVDLQRYSGRWYIIANIPYFAEAGQVGRAGLVTVRLQQRHDLLPAPAAVARAVDENERRHGA